MRCLTNTPFFFPKQKADLFLFWRPDDSISGMAFVSSSARIWVRPGLKICVDRCSLQHLSSCSWVSKKVLRGKRHSYVTVTEFGDGPAANPLFSSDDHATNSAIKASSADSNAEEPANPFEDYDESLDTSGFNDTDAVEEDSDTVAFLQSRSLAQYVEGRTAENDGIPPTPNFGSEWLDCWALSVGEAKSFEMMNQYSRVGILMEHNFGDFVPPEGYQEIYENASIEDISLLKAKVVHDATGLPCISETCDMTIDPPESGSRINKSLQQGYYTRNIEEEADTMIERVLPISDENRLVRFYSVAVYYDGEHEIVKSKRVNVAMVFAEASKSVIATAGALDEMFIELSKKFGLNMAFPLSGASDGDNQKGSLKEKVFVGATLLRERILREGKVLGDGIIKVSSFMNHKVDTDLMNICGEELAERLRHTMPNKLLTVESTGLVAAFPTARRLQVPLVFARKSRPITISDSYQTTYRSATKGTTSDLIVSCEYLDPGDRVLIIDDFLAGGSTAEALFRLAKMAHAKVVGVGVLIEKMSDGGRTFLSGYDVPVVSLAKVSIEEGSSRILVQEEDPWVPPDSKVGEKEVQEHARYAQSKYYSRTGEGSAPLDGSMGELAELDINEENDEIADDDDDGVDVIRWDDEGNIFDELEEDTLDKLQDDLIRNRGRN